LVKDGNDVESIDLALRAARRETRCPSPILVRTHSGFGSPNKQNTFEAHGSPLGVEEVKLTRQKLDWPIEPLFDIPPEALAHFREALPRGEQAESGVARSIRSLRQVEVTAGAAENDSGCPRGRQESHEEARQ
jgi:transketolase